MSVGQATIIPSLAAYIKLPRINGDAECIAPITSSASRSNRVRNAAKQRSFSSGAGNLGSPSGLLFLYTLREKEEGIRLERRIEAVNCNSCHSPPKISLRFSNERSNFHWQESFDSQWLVCLLRLP